MARILQILFVVLLSASFAWCDQSNDDGRGGDPNPPHKKNKQGKARPANSKNGRYKTIIAGTFRGIGTANITEDGVSFQIDVVASDGSSGKFVADNLALDGPYFTGTGSAIGHSVTIQGRLDADKASRMTATYTGSNGESGRIVGTLADSAATATTADDK